jgi:hypothetical protein
MSSEALAIDLVLELYSQSYQSPPKPEPKITFHNSGVKITEPNKEVPTPKIDVPIPNPGTLNAEGFMLALKNAGVRRNESGKLLRHPNLILQDEKLAIAAWIGYLWHAPHGIQLDAARFKARFAIKPERAAEYKRGIAATIAGFVKGTPSLVDRYRDDLLGREQQAIELALGYEKAAEECHDGKDKLILQGKALVERERASVIRRDLIALAVAQAQEK